MNRLFKKKFITSIIFIIFLIFFSIMNFFTSYKYIIQSIKDNISNDNKSNLSTVDKINNLFLAADDAINENVYKKYGLIESYGYMQKLMGKNEVNNFEIIKDNQGLLHYTYFADKPNDVSEIVEDTITFKDNLISKDSVLIYLMTPDKYIIGKTTLETGLSYNYANETADNYLQSLKENNINYIDLRKLLDSTNKTTNELFYSTDHHWKIETAFESYCEIIKILNEEYKNNLDPEKYFTDSNNYNFETYKNSYLGSMGRKIGKYYDGIDDFTLIYPKFETSYSFYAKTNGTETKKEGRFEEALIHAYSLNYNKDIYSPIGDKYFSYLTGNHGFVHIKNKDITNGRRIMFIKDSYAVPVAAFMSTVASDVYLIDPRYYTGNILDAVNEADCDYIFISFYPQNLTSEFFRLNSSLIDN